MKDDLRNELANKGQLDDLIKRVNLIEESVNENI